jgi:hypothetical protein
MKKFKELKPGDKIYLVRIKEEEGISIPKFQIGTISSKPNCHFAGPYDCRLDFCTEESIWNTQWVESSKCEGWCQKRDSEDIIIFTSENAAKIYYKLKSEEAQVEVSIRIRQYLKMRKTLRKTL